MADEKNTEKDPEKGTDLEGTTPSEQDATAPDVGENAEAENPTQEAIDDDVQPGNGEEILDSSTSHAAAEEFDEDDYIDMSAIESELQLLLPNLTNISETLVEAVELSTQNAKKLKSQESTLVAAFKSLNDFKKEQVKFGTIMLVTTGGIIAVALGLFLAAILSLSGKGEELSALNLALGKRIVELNVGLTSFEEAKAEVATLRGVIETLAVGVEQTQASYSESEQEIQGQLSVYSESLVSELTNQNTTLGESFDALGSKVTAFEAKINSFDSRLQQTDRTLADIQENAKALLAVRDVVEALLVLERERYLEALDLTSPAPTEAIEEVRRDGEIYFGGGATSGQ
jgi:chromosome segregation ATPase